MSFVDRSGAVGPRVSLVHPYLDPLRVKAELHLLADDDGGGDPGPSRLRNHLLSFRRVGRGIDFGVGDSGARKPRLRLLAEESAWCGINDYRFAWLCLCTLTLTR